MITGNSGKINLYLFRVVFRSIGTNETTIVLDIYIICRQFLSELRTATAIPLHLFFFQTP